MLMRISRPVLLTLLLLAPTRAHATEIGFFFESGGGQNYVNDYFVEVVPNGFTFGLFDGMTLTASAFPNGGAQPNAAGGYDYAFDNWFMTFFIDDVAAAWIPVLRFTLSVSAPEHHQSSGVWPEGTSVGRMVSSGLNLTLGPGIIDPVVAAAAHVHSVTLGGTALLMLDDFLPHCGPFFEDQSSECAVLNHLSGRIDVDAPEPATLALVALGLTGLVAS